MIMDFDFSQLTKLVSPSDPASRKTKKPKRVLVTIGDLYPYVQTKITHDETGRMRCRWCNVVDGDGPHSKIVDRELGLCHWCFKQIVDAKGRRCIYCCNVSERRLEKGLCITCRGEAEHIPINLERITKKLGWVAGLILIIPRVFL
jgi:hypothetical protein